MKKTHQKCVFRSPSHTKNREPQIQQKCLIYILIAILFFAHMKVNVAAILDFFI